MEDSYKQLLEDAKKEYLKDSLKDVLEDSQKDLLENSQKEILKYFYNELLRELQRISKNNSWRKTPRRNFWSRSFPVRNPRGFPEEWPGRFLDRSPRGFPECTPKENFEVFQGKILEKFQTDLLGNSQKGKSVHCILSLKSWKIFTERLQEHFCRVPGNKCTWISGGFPE